MQFTMEDWTKIIDNLGGSADDDGFALPQPQIIEQKHFETEISYQWVDENEQDQVIRTEKRYKIIEMKQKISKQAINRQKLWKKFGQVSNISRGVLEKGISLHRPDQVPFLWNGMSIKEMEKIQKKKEELHLLQKKQQQQQQQQQQDVNNIKYRAPTSLILDDIFEIRISNLPDWSEWAHIKQLIDAFYRKYLNIRHPPKYKIRMFTTRYEGEKNAIVQFENERFAQQAIKQLNGHQYEYHILKVEKSIPRR